MAEQKSPNILGIALLAGLAGAGIALLYAPKSGKETREHIHKRTDELKKQAEQNVEQAKARLKHNAEKLEAWKNHMAKKAQDEGKKVADHLDSTSQENNDINNSILKNWEEEA